MKWIALTIVVVLLVPSLATADLLCSQPFTYNGAVISQDFPDFWMMSTFSFDDFSVPESGWVIDKVTIRGVESGDPTKNVSVNLGFYSAPNVADLQTSLFTGTQVGADLVFNLPDVPVAAGTEWLSAWVQRPFFTGGQWSWDFSMPVTGNEFMLECPAGYWGQGTDPIAGSVFLSAIEQESVPPRNLAFTIEGREASDGPTPELPPIALLSALPIGLAWLRRRARQ